MQLLGSSEGGAPSEGAPPGKKADKRKQTIIALAAVLTLAVTYLLYRRSAATSSANAANAAQATTPTQNADTGGSASTPDMSGLFSSISQQIAADEQTIASLQSGQSTQTTQLASLTAELAALEQSAQAATVSVVSKAETNPVTPGGTKKAPIAILPHTAVGQTYTVRGGDTLSAIAARFGEPLSQLESSNEPAIAQQGNNNLIHPGLVLKVK